MKAIKETKETNKVSEPIETNKVFELIDYLIKNIENIKKYEKLMKQYDRLRDEMRYLEPANALEDDTKYKEKEKEFDVLLVKWDEIKKPYNDKINSFEFNRYYFQKDLKSILNKWIKNIIEKEDAEIKKNALNEIREYKDKFTMLQTDLIIKFMRHLNFDFYDLDYVLNGSTIYDDVGFFSKYIQPKYSGLSKALQDYLKGANDEVIESIIDNKQLPHGATKPQWIKKADAVRFGKYVGLEYSQLRELFDNNVKANDKPNDIDNNNEIRNILSQHKVPQAEQE